MLKTFVYKLERRVATVSVLNGELAIEGEEDFVQLVREIYENSSKYRTPEEFVRDLPQRLRSQIHCQVVED